MMIKNREFVDQDANYKIEMVKLSKYKTVVKSTYSWVIIQFYVTVYQYLGN